LDHKRDKDILRIKKPSVEIRKQLDAILNRNKVTGKSREKMKIKIYMNRSRSGERATGRTWFEAASRVIDDN
jgi:hypothetical protein